MQTDVFMFFVAQVTCRRGFKTKNIIIYNVIMYCTFQTPTSNRILWLPEDVLELTVHHTICCTRDNVHSYNMIQYPWFSARKNVLIFVLVVLRLGYTVCTQSVFCVVPSCVPFFLFHRLSTLKQIGRAFETS